MQYAVIKSGGKQYRVDIGDKLTVDRINSENKKTIVFEDVLLLVKDGKVVVGSPNVKGAKVEANFIEDKRGKKIEVRKFKAKSRYRRKIGFRSNQTVVEIKDIKYKEMFSSKKITKPVKTAEKSKKK